MVIVIPMDGFAIAQYFREVRERLHSDAYQQLREINN